VKHDWDKLRAEYVTSMKSYSEISEEHGILKSVLGRRAKAENWPAQRIAYKQEVAKKAIQKQGNKDVRQLAVLMDAAESLSYQLLGLINDDEQFYRYVDSGYVEDARGVKVHMHNDYVSEKADTKALSNAARALADMTRTMRNLYGLPDYQDKEKSRMEKRKLKMLEEKKGTDLPEGSYGVAMMPGRGEEDPNAVEVE
jgi:hypothetical protein